MSSLQLVEYRKKSYKVGLDLEEASRRREEDLEEVRLSKREENLLNKRGGGEELLLLQSKKLFSDASQTHDDETGEMVGLDLEVASRRREDNLEEVRLSKCEDNLLSKGGGGEELLLQSKMLFLDALQTHDDETREMDVAKAGFEAIRVLSEVRPQHTECNDAVAAAAALAIAKAISEGSDEQIRCLVEHGCIEKLCGLLKYPDPKIVVCCLEGLRSILKVGVVDQRAGKNGGKNIYRVKIAECGGLDSIESLTDHDNPEDTAWFEAFKKALVIRCSYFPFDEYCIRPDGYESREWSYQVIESPSAYQSYPLEGVRGPVIRFTVP